METPLDPPPEDEVTRSDAALMERAIRMKWRIPADTAEKLPNRLCQLLDSKDERIRIRAAEALFEANAQNGPADNSGPPVRLHICNGPLPPASAIDDPQDGGVDIYIPDNGRSLPET